MITFQVLVKVLLFLIVIVFFFIVIRKNKTNDKVLDPYANAITLYFEILKHYHQYTKENDTTLKNEKKSKCLQLIEKLRQDYPKTTYARAKEIKKIQECLQNNTTISNK